MTLFQAALKIGGADVATPHGALHVLLKQTPVVLQDLSSFLVQWVFRVGLLWPLWVGVNRLKGQKSQPLQVLPTNSYSPRRDTASHKLWSLS